MTTVAAREKILVGIAGWSYDDWKGVVYPRGCRDTLRACAELVDVIEINNTFYRLPVAAHGESWLARVRDLPLRFTAKVPGEFTHKGATDPSLVREVHDGFAPLAGSGRLVTLLAQFPHWFDHSAANVDRVRWLRESFSSIAPITVEVRHRSWNGSEAREDLASFGVGVADLDYPGNESGFSRSLGLRGQDGLAYLRIHGRNAAAWFDPKAGRDDVYDYEYDRGEVEELEMRSVELGAEVGETLVIANNHFEGKAMKLALELLAKLRERKVRVPDPLLRAYPDLKTIASAVQGGLFD